MEVTSEKQEKDTSHEFNSYYTRYAKSMVYDEIFKCGLYDYFSQNEIDAVLRDPIGHYETAIRLSEFVYGKNGIVSNSIDYMTALLCLDRVITNKSTKKKADAKALKKNKELMKSTLNTIDDKTFIRNALFTEMLAGIAFFYFETKKRKYDKSKYMSDYDVLNITEINEAGINANIISLPWKYTKIVGKKNGRYVLAFNLRYFDDCVGDTLERKLRKYPDEISKAYNEGHYAHEWVVLDSNKTMCKKIKCKDNEPWGRSLILAALPDVLYKDYFTDTKRNILDELNNQIIYETFPEGKDKGSCALTAPQQQEQHNTVKQAIMQKNNRGGTSFFSVSSGTKLDKIEVNTDIFNDGYESDLNNQIALDLGICSSLLGATVTGNYGSSQSNLEIITAQLYTWMYEWQQELNFVINQNIIKDKNNPVEIYYFPTSFVNRKQFFDMMKDLYTTASGSLSFLIASAGIDPDTYLGVLDDEIDNGIYEKYKPHQTSYTYTGEVDDVGGREVTDTPTENTIKSRENDGNSIPSPSDT